MANRPRDPSKWPAYYAYQADIDLKRHYGISRADYNEMLAAQNGGCALCGGDNANGKPLFVDHCHDTGAVRGLLCHHCNSGLGYFKDTPGLLRLAATYLDRHKAP